MGRGRDWEIVFGGTDISLRLFTYSRWRRLCRQICRIILFGSGPYRNIIRWEYLHETVVLDLIISDDDALNADPTAYETFTLLRNLKGSRP